MTTARPLDWPETLGGHYLTYSDHDPSWGGGEGTLAAAQQACRDAALGPLDGQDSDLGIWLDTDPETGTLFEINLQDETSAPPDSPPTR